MGILGACTRCNEYKQNASGRQEQEIILQLLALQNQPKAIILGEDGIFQGGYEPMQWKKLNEDLLHVGQYPLPLT